MNALVATLMTYDEDRFDLRSFTLWTFRSALEYTVDMPEEGEEEAGNDSRECHILAAVKLVEIAGHVICRWDYEFCSGSLVGDPGKGGALWDGMHWFCRGRWGLWKWRFREVSCEEGMSEEVKQKARRAGEAMAKVDA